MEGLTKKECRALLERVDLTIEELVEESAELLDRIAPTQTRYKVRERPDVRTIRYYISQKLLPKPDSYKKGRARFNGAHLLRLLAIKRMQAEHQTLVRIAQKLEDAADDRLIGLLADQKEIRSPRTVRRSPTKKETKRLELQPGGCVEVPQAILRDPEQRKQLAQNLEVLASWLKSCSNDEGVDP